MIVTSPPLEKVEPKRHLYYYFLIIYIEKDELLFSIFIKYKKRDLDSIIDIRPGGRIVQELGSIFNNRNNEIDSNNAIEGGCKRKTIKREENKIYE